MAIINSYPTVTPSNSDLLLLVDTSVEGNPTKTATVSSVSSLVNKGYKSYVARFSRDASASPGGEITELYNDTGLTFTWSVNNPEGVISIDASSDLGTKVVCFTSCGSNAIPGDGFPYQFDFKRPAYNNGLNIAMFCRRSDTGAIVTTYFGSIEIKIYD